MNKEEQSSDEFSLNENQRLNNKLINLENEIHTNYLDEYNKQQEKIHSLENELSILKSTINNHKDLQTTIEHLQNELQRSVSYNYMNKEKFYEINSISRLKNVKIHRY